MLFFLLSFLSLLIFFSKSLPSQPLPSWATEMRLLSLLFCKEFLFLSVQWLKSARLFLPAAALLGTPHRKMPTTRKQVARESEAADEHAEEEVSILDLPELALDCILGRLSPAELCAMACVCSSLRERCTSGYVWERHMREKWGGVIGAAAREEWQWHVASKRGDGKARGGGLLGSVPCMWPLSWIRSKLDGGRGSRCCSSPAVDSVMSWYLALEGGKFCFPAQVYNRENGHVGFMLSCYDAELTYDRRTDTFRAKYPPHGRRTIVVEDGVNWDRVRAPPTNTSAHDLHVSDCLSDLHPGDHIEIQWRRNKEFPYGWWYGTVGHLESCDGSELYCHCHSSGTVVLEFNQYAPGSRWRRSAINRRDHREEGNEADGFYGGIRKLRSKDEISTWTTLWPTEVLE